MNNVRLFRKKLNFTVEVLSQRVGISTRHLQFIESGKREPSLHVAKKIADCLDSTVDKVFFGKEDDV